MSQAVKRDISRYLVRSVYRTLWSFKGIDHAHGLVVDKSGICLWIVMHRGFLSLVVHTLSTVSTELSTEIPWMSFRFFQYPTRVMHSIHSRYDYD